MSHLLALGLLALDCLVRAWRIQLAVWTAGGRLGFEEAVRLNLYGEAASTLTPNRLGGGPARVPRVQRGGGRPGAGPRAGGARVAGGAPRLGARAPRPLVAAGRWRAAHRRQHRRARADPAGAGVGRAAPAPLRPDVLRCAHADSRPVVAAAAVRGWRSRGGVSLGVRRGLRRAPAHDLAAVAALHPPAPPHPRRLRAPPARRLPGGDGEPADRLG